MHHDFVELTPQLPPGVRGICNPLKKIMLSNHAQIRYDPTIIRKPILKKGTVAYFLASIGKYNDMKTLLIIATTILLPLQGVAQNTYTSTKGYVSFFSKAPIADVDAKNEKVKVQMNTSDGEVTFDMTMTDFEFKSEKMGRDARKKYLEIG